MSFCPFLHFSLQFKKTCLEVAVGPRCLFVVLVIDGHRVVVSRDRPLFRVSLETWRLMKNCKALVRCRSQIFERNRPRTSIFPTRHQLCPLSDRVGRYITGGF